MKTFIGRCKNKACRRPLRFKVEVVTRQVMRFMQPGNRDSAYVRNVVDHYVYGGQRLPAGGSVLSVPCPACQVGTVAGKALHGVYSERHACGSRCTGATGHDCECQCGGKNHGADHG